MATKVDIREEDRFFVNADFDINFAIKQANGTTAQAITGWALSWKMKRRQSDPDASAVISKSTAAGITITDGPNGLGTVDITDDDTVALKPGVYLHELKRTDAGFETPLITGSVILRGSLHTAP